MSAPLNPLSVESLRERFKQGLPDTSVATDAADLEHYGKDWTKVYVPAPALIAFPKSTGEVSQILRFCNDEGFAVVPSGGRTGLSGGAVAARGEVVLSLSRMNRIGEIDPVSSTVRVEAGAVTEAVHQAALPFGLTWPIDFASKGSSQVGGNISTNAGGVKVIRYGLTRQWVLGLTVVLMDGRILELNGALEKNQSGIDLRQWFIGSEGILGVVTEAVLKLTRVPVKHDVYFFALESLDRVYELFLQARQGPFTVSAFECLSHACLESVTAHLGLAAPFAARSAQYVLLETEPGARPEESEAWLTRIFEEGIVVDGVQAQSPREATDLWKLREGISESLSARAQVHKHDISLPISMLRSFLAEWEPRVREENPDFGLFIFGHIGDGNLHVNIQKPDSIAKDDFLARVKVIDEALFPLVKKYHGSISAEHGIGLLKKPWLSFTRTAEEIALMKQLKQTLDPRGLLNPGKVL